MTSLLKPLQERVRLRILYAEISTIAERTRAFVEMKYLVQNWEIGEPVLLNAIEDLFSALK